MISESQRLERLAERLRAVEPAVPSPPAKIRAWNLVLAEVQKPGSLGREARSTGRLILAGLAAAVLLVAGVVAAAADSLPDSALYPVKGTIEAVQGAFAVSPTDRFNYHLSLAQTRLREATAMFARHRVDLADHALTALDDQLTSAATVVKGAKAANPAVAASLRKQLLQAVVMHDAQLAGLQGQLGNPTAVTAITKARTRAQEVVQVATAPADQGQSNGDHAPSGKASAEGSPTVPSDSIKPSLTP